MQHVVDNIKYAKESYSDSLTKEDLELVEEVKSIYLKRCKVNCTACYYCMPCPAGVNIPVNFSHLNNFVIYKVQHLQNFSMRHLLLIPKKL